MGRVGMGGYGWVGSVGYMGGVDRVNLYYTRQH